MSGANQFGQFFRVTTFGESHGEAIGCVIDGCPAGVEISKEFIQKALNRRKPGTNAWTSARNESDAVEILSGIHEGRTLGTPIAAMVRNQDARSADYQTVGQAIDSGLNLRAGHADDQWRKKFGHSDVRGGGRASGRETLARVIAGAVARKVCQALAPEIRVLGFASSIGEIVLPENERNAVFSSPAEFPADAFSARFPSPTLMSDVENLLVSAVKDGRSYGGVAEILVSGAPQGLGAPVFHKLKSDLASAFFSVGATAGVEIGDGFESVEKEGTSFHSGDGSIYGGIRGGISTGEPISARVAFKPTSTVMDLAKRGRHDPCIVPRALPVLEAMTWLVLCDHLLWRRLDKIGTI